MPARIFHPALGQDVTDVAQKTEDVCFDYAMWGWIDRPIGALYPKAFLQEQLEALDWRLQLHYGDVLRLLFRTFHSAMSAPSFLTKVRRMYFAFEHLEAMADRLADRLTPILVE